MRCHVFLDEEGESRVVKKRDGKDGKGKKDGKDEFDRFDFEARIVPTPVTLFRYSALTFNSHRIHYDYDYCRNVEGLAGPLVHGPMTATHLVNEASRHIPSTHILSSFNYKALSPWIVNVPGLVRGRVEMVDDDKDTGKRVCNVKVWVCREDDGVLMMEGVAVAVPVV
ncbi:hypothetical protein HDU76_004124 [Blyttiomyces sp. JEL0837]|nr:hypothetical protein HDU76_004124 [Blyttiomyces sp. JEL0837]